MTVCERCSFEDAYDVKTIRVYESTEYDRLNLCAFCRGIPGGVIRTNEGIALSMVGNILARAIREAQNLTSAAPARPTDTAEGA